MTRQASSLMAGDIARARALVEAVADPELPPLTIGELGIVRDVFVSEEGALVVSVTPTYSGCPAVEFIETRIAEVLQADGFDEVRVLRVFTPAWTSDWMTATGRAKLASSGIAPPRGGDRGVNSPVAVSLGRTSAAAATSPNTASPDTTPLACPRCAATDVTRISAFGSTACKALYRCNACLEPFDHFKEI